MTNILRVLVRVALLACVGLTARTRSAPSQQPASRSEFLVTKGKDTVAVEIFSRDAGTLTSEIYQTNGPRTQYTMNLRPDGVVQHLEYTRVTRAGQSVGITAYIGDTLVTAAMSGGGESEKFEMPFHGKATPFLAVSFALCEQIVQASHLDVGKSAKWTALRLGAADTASLTVTRFHADSVLLAMPDIQLKVALSSKGELVGGQHLGQGWLVERKTVR